MANSFPLEDPEISAMACTEILRNVVDPRMAQVL
jgi:hypothetical protein